MLALTVSPISTAYTSIESAPLPIVKSHDQVSPNLSENDKTSNSCLSKSYMRSLVEAVSLNLFLSLGVIAPLKNPKALIALPIICDKTIASFIGYQRISRLFFPIHDSLWSAGNALLRNFSTGIVIYHKDLSDIVIFATIEEIYYRVLIQDFLLKKLPSNILKHTAPSYQHLVDHKITKAARIILTSMFFALAHEQRWDCSPSGGTAYQFALGISTGILMEQTNSVTLCAIEHIIHNLIYAAGGDLLRRYIGVHHW